MRAGDGERLHAEVASVLDWWVLAGVDMAVAEDARDWLRPIAPPPAAAEVPAVEAAAQPALPDTLDGFVQWLAGHDDDALLGPRLRRVAPEGDATAALMILVDMPGQEDAEEGRLLSGAAGRLLDRMLAAIGAARDGTWLAPLSPARPAGGRIAAQHLAPLAAMARHQLALVKPDRLILFGAQAAEAMLGLGHADARGRLHNINGIPTIATFNPQVLLGAPAMKAGAWADLRLMLKGEQ
ncbi:uracil-DNA glycosylase [Sphingomonas quercus]|uniref:Uracil-DNA glycosylase n=1 Tax=Sphingomonas quercus TaxID=2842451 RepID=A0ABS6BNP4_9SPHN|nr:uracil-DNA glycosylase [Sphingomonas quercus]MBU3079011.1 uracil-DNA glycosylase [Sphingomonas quercus]